jgi:hypothetical protein
MALGLLTQRPNDATAYDPAAGTANPTCSRCNFACALD